MDTFQRSETVVCSITIKTAAGVLTSPATSTTITLTSKESGVVVVNATAMTNDGVGLYHYDFQTSDVVLGIYYIKYIATDGTRITVQLDEFEVV